MVIKWTNDHCWEHGFERAKGKLPRLAVQMANLVIVNLVSDHLKRTQGIVSHNRESAGLGANKAAAQ